MKAIRTLERRDSSLTIGSALLGRIRERRASIRQAVHDGDTLNVEANGDFGVRLLGIDTPEVSFRLPPGRAFPMISSPAWKKFLTDPFADDYGPFSRELPAGLIRHIQAAAGPTAAETHYDAARQSEDAFESLIEHDMEVLEQTPDTFRFFLAFAFEVMDGYGRFLCYINREQPDRNQPEPRPLSYNERLLELGRAFPYFIWPNVNPYRRANIISDAVIPPGMAKTLADDDSTIRQARQSVGNARANHLGIFDAMNPVTLEPFELRWPASRSAPHRWVIDLTRNDDVLLRPENYYTIPHPEDRLFIPEHFVPLFVERGWKREA